MKISVALSIARREMSSYFFSPIAYVVVCLFLILSAIIFLIFTLRAGGPAEMRVLFAGLVWVLIPVLPAIGMRLIAEEHRSGTIESLMTCPISDTQVVLGKWLGAVGFYVVILATTFIYVIALTIWADPDWGPIFTGYVGLLLVGALYLAIGTFASTLSRNQIVAFLVAVAIILLLTLVATFLPRAFPDSWQQNMIVMMSYVNVNDHFEAFRKGLIDTSNFVYFLSGTALFLVLAVKALESRRWR